MDAAVRTLLESRKAAIRNTNGYDSCSSEYQTICAILDESPTKQELSQEEKIIAALAKRLGENKLQTALNYAELEFPCEKLIIEELIGGGINIIRIPYSS